MVTGVAHNVANLGPTYEEAVAKFRAALDRHVVRLVRAANVAGPVAGPSNNS